jgi:hypothetical protein
VRTEESEELFLARMRPVLEHRSFSLFFHNPLARTKPWIGNCLPTSPAQRSGASDSTTIFESQRTCNRLLEHLQHHRMIGADDGTSVFDPENLLLDEAESFVVGRSSEELGDRLTDIIFVIPGGMGMTRRCFMSQKFGITSLLGPGVKSVSVHEYTTFADC